MFRKVWESTTVVIVASRRDAAALNIASHLNKNYSNDNADETSGFERPELGIRLVYIDEDAVSASTLDKRFEAESLIVVSRHRSESGQPALTVHATGNLTSQAPLGGTPKTVSWVDPARSKAALRALVEAKKSLSLSDFSVVMEATHHGPTDNETPVLFVEIGSSEREWINTSAGQAVAEAAWRAATAPVPGKNSVAFGGGHYSAKHTDHCLSSELAVGHIVPKYFFEEFDPTVLKQCFARTKGHCATALIDWKGLRGHDRSRLLQVLEHEKIEIIRA